MGWGVLTKKESGKRPPTSERGRKPNSNAMQTHGQFNTHILRYGRGRVHKVGSINSEMGERKEVIQKVKVVCDIMGEPNLSEQSSDAVSMERSLRRWRIRADETVSG